MADDKRPTLADLEAAGYEIGQMVAALASGALRGMADYNAAPPAPELTEDRTEPPEKTRIADCRACWCDDCRKLEECEATSAIMNPNGIKDGIRPNPCIGCQDGWRFMPKESEPDCGSYEPADQPNNG